MPPASAAVTLTAKQIDTLKRVDRARREMAEALVVPAAEASAAAAREEHRLAAQSDRSFRARPAGAGGLAPVRRRPTASR